MQSVESRSLGSHRVLRDVRVTNKYDLFDALVDPVAQIHPELDLNDVMQRLVDREQDASTAFGKGVAMPHALIPGLQQEVLVSAILEQPFDYDGDGNTHIEVAFMLLSPADAPEQHLTSLSRLAWACRKDGFVGDFVQRVAAGKFLSLVRS